RLAHRQMLRLDRGRPPAPVPFRLPRGDAAAVGGQQGVVRCVPLRPLPAAAFEEEGAQFLLPGIERAGAHRPVALPLLARVYDAVDLREAFGRPRVYVGRTA